LAGKRVICWATGGDTTPPSEKNSNIEWIFSTSLKSAQFNSQTEPKKIGQGRLHLVHIGRQEWEKGAHILIEAMPEVLSKFPEATLSVVGAGSALPALVKLSESNGLQNKIIFTGKLNQAGVLNILDNSSVFCFPSYSSEGFPKVVLEAMSRGVPVITSKVSILKKLIPESGAGELMIDCTKKSFLEALYKLTSTSGHYENCSINALSYSGQFTLEKWADLIITKIEYTWKVKIH
jgi:glycosyltransferase involved in cell wall biosynthesis